MSEAFELDPRLESDTLAVDELELNAVRLMNDSAYPWLVLVPMRPGLKDFHDLSAEDLPVMAREMVQASRVLERLHRPDRVNVAALGSQVAQLHVHVIARFEADPAWPGPVWGVQPHRPYPQAELEDALAALRGGFVEF